MGNGPSTSRSGAGVEPSTRTTSSLYNVRALRQETAEFLGRWYVLRGYDDLLDDHPILFRHPLPDSRVCAVCHQVVVVIAMLPCGHSVCEVCRHSVFQKTRSEEHVGICPADGVKFTVRDVQMLQFRPKHLASLQVYCLNIKYDCTFQGEFEHLARHYRTSCSNHPKTCDRCRRKNIPACDIALHKTICNGNPNNGNDSSNSSVDGSEAAANVSSEAAIAQPVKKELLDFFQDTVQYLSLTRNLQESVNLRELLETRLSRLNQVLDELPEAYQEPVNLAAGDGRSAWKLLPGWKFNVL